MKKLIIIFFLGFISTAFSQNLQLHYDFGKDREYFTSTIEMFRPDEYGATFFFVDMDYNRGGNKNMSLSYFEIARYVNLPFVKGLSATAQYNDGILNVGTLPNGLGIDVPLGHIWLAGLSYPINLGFITLNTDLLFRKDYLSENSADAQLTTVWFVPFLNGKVTFTGFMDIWSTKQVGENKFVLLSEPQLWLNLTNHLSIGSEVEISNNFIPGENSVQFNPTLAAKWNF